MTHKTREVYLNKIKHNIIIVILAFACILLLALGIHHNLSDNQPKEVHTAHTVAKAHPKKPHVEHEVNHLSLVKKKKGLPKLKLAKSVIAMDADSGDILYQKNENQPRKVASIAKLMTLYLVEKRAGRNPHLWNETVPETENRNLRKMSYSKTVGGFKFKRGHHYTVKELFKAALIESSNNGAIALGQWVAGSNAKFVDMMNRQAHLWGIQAHFVSSCGLENDDLEKYHQNVSDDHNAANLLSAKAVAIIAKHLINQYPSVTKLSKLPSDKVDGQILENANGLVPGGRFPQMGTHVNGLKTGFTPKAGFCFVSTSTHKNEHPLIIVVLHDRNEFTDVRSMINYLDKNSQEMKEGNQNA